MAYDDVNFYHGTDLHKYGAVPKRTHKDKRTQHKSKKSTGQSEDHEWGDQSRMDASVHPEEDVDNDLAKSVNKQPI